MIKYNFICDLEFSASSPMRGQILETSLIVTDLNLNILNRFHAKSRPEIINAATWTQAAQNAHKITPQQAMSHPYSRRELCFLLLNFLAPYYFECLEPQPFVCHAIDKGFKDSWPYIDFHFLDWAFRNERLEKSLWKIINSNQLISTIKIAREFGLFAMNQKADKNGRVSNRKSYKLDLLCPLIGFELDHHKSMSDAEGALAIMRYCRQDEEILK